MTTTMTTTTMTTTTMTTTETASRLVSLGYFGAFSGEEAIDDSVRAHLQGEFDSLEEEEDSGSFAAILAGVRKLSDAERIGLREWVRRESAARWTRETW